ncbi:hypothetical protein M0Q97_04245 [Candidatus Dojkabacteria bacterium]|jgi:hypothetical protein|nr:hypothetical protein [Candidatus Dojkabacteria bacterium]
MSNYVKIPMIIFASLFTILFSYWILCLNHTSVNQIGIAYNSLNGEITVQKTPGWYVTSPLVQVAYISTLPIKVTIPSEAKVIVSKMVKFNPNGVNDFIQLQGFSYSINSSLQNIMLGYAFSGNKYTFMDIIQDTNEETLGTDRNLVK